MPPCGVGFDCLTADWSFQERTLFGSPYDKDQNMLGVDFEATPSYGNLQMIHLMLLP